MTDLFWPYLGSIAATAVGLLVVIVSFFNARSRTRAEEERLIELQNNYEGKLKLIPDAVEHVSLSAEVGELRTQKKSLQAVLTQAESRLQLREITEKWLEQNLARYERANLELPNLEAKAQSIADQLKSLNVERDAANKVCNQALARKAQLDAEVAPIQERVNQKAVIEKWIAEKQPIYEQQAALLPGLKEETANLRSDVQALNADLNMLEVERDRVAKQGESLAKEIHDLQGAHNGQVAERTKRQDEINALQATQGGLLKEAEQARVERDTAHAQFVTARSELEDVRRELSKRREEMTELESERATKLEVAQMLDRLVKKLEADKKQVEDELERSKLRLERELDQINSLIAAAVKRWGDVGPTVGANDTNRLAELWTPVLKKADLKAAFKPKSSDSERESLERTSQHLLHQGLRFDRRVLNAFHTSLKVAEMSPLVVLAGISGTGKSELPRRYAEGMGMHSLTLAVQPRWDSPQDMFGFYNYLESRYRATELARALVQMDRFAKERKTDWNYPDDWLTESLSDRMLLVLLDEMNLARVEYYFSEFLSKLETRRGIDRNNATERRKAEIMLEVGLSSMRRKDGAFEITQQPTLPMFVDRNVLFVGTMNEDETTQTLSDKVVDRANVLRFGRPKKLGAETNGTQTKPTEAWLPYTTWIGWVRDEDTFNGSVRAECEGWIHELNQAMQSIGRPFAHRTYGAMLSYVANYPEQNQHKLAMADQIELKLLPKFRGLDPSEQVVRSALSTLQSVIGKLGDEKLANAVREASKASEHQFVWHGVDRMDES